MKRQIASTQEKRQSSLQRIRKEPSTGGNATIEDYRAETVVQRQLQETMHAHSSDRGVPIQQKNNTGLPDHLKSGIENLSGYNMDDVKVHYNSSRPAQLQAHAYAQGTDIHLASGQEKHLPHEAWHVVQQKQGRVKPTRQLKSKVNINDDSGLEKEADVMGSRALSSNKSTNQLKTNLIHHTKQPNTKQPIVQRKIKIENKECTVAEASSLIEAEKSSSFEPKEFEATRKGILPVYDKVNKNFDSVTEFMDTLNKIKGTYSMVWNIESISLIDYIAHQETIQHIVKDDLVSFEYLLTTVGFEHEFAGMEESPLSGVSHLEFARTEKEMPFTDLPFILETDASDAIELVSPPFLMPTVKGIPLPDPKKVGIVDKNMQKALFKSVEDTNRSKFVKPSIRQMLHNLNKKIGWKFNLKDNIEIKPDNLSNRTIVDYLAGDLIEDNGNLILDKNKVGDYTIGKSKKIEKYHSNKKEEYKLAKYNTAPQVNFATDIATVALLEQATKSTVSNRETVKVYKDLEKVLIQSIKKPKKESSGMSEFYIQMTRKLAGLLSVYAQKKTREDQMKLYASLLKKANNEEITDEVDVSNMFDLTSWHSNVKDTTSIWVKDHIVNIAYGMLGKEDFPVLIELLKEVNIEEPIDKFLEGLSKEYTELAKKRSVYLKGIDRVLGRYLNKKNEYEAFAKENKSYPKTYKSLERYKDEFLKEKEKYERLAARIKEFKEPFITLLKTTISSIIIDLENNEGNSKPNLRDEGIYGHDETKGGARQATYLDPEVVNKHKLWPQKLLVAEIRRGDMERQLEDALRLVYKKERKQQTEDNRPLIKQQLEDAIKAKL